MHALPIINFFCFFFMFFREVVGLKTFSQLFLSVGTFGLTGLDKLYSFMIVRVMQRFATDYRKVMKGDKTLKLLLQQVHDALEPVTAIPSNFAKIYPVAINKLPNLSKIFTDYIVRVGHLQLLRRMVANELNVCLFGSFFQKNEKNSK